MAAINNKNLFLLIVAFTLLTGKALGQVQNTSMVFAPSENLIKPVEKPYRQSICLNGQWDFQPVELPANFKEGIDPAPVLPAVRPDEWSKVPIRIPSPWNVNSFADKNSLGGDFICYPSYPKEWEKVKMGWLRKKIVVPATWKLNKIQLHFEAVAGNAEIFVNGKKVGEHFDIFLPFDVDITNAVVFGKENEICVGVKKASLFDVRSDYGRRTYQAGSFWGQHIAGIWQDVYLVALPKIRVENTFIKPLLSKNKLEVEVTLINETDKTANISVEADVYKWISHAGKNIITAPLPSSEIEKNSALQIPAIAVSIPAHAKSVVTLSSPVADKLKLWFPQNPNLYALVVKPVFNGQVTDVKYTRFGWREFSFEGNQFLLNGKPFIIKGDSWHFLGIPQMTRRYAWAWFTALRDANLNAVRLHAEPYPSFYLDVADEMGILVLDETAVWASDGGTKLNDPAYWADSKNHLASLIMRDRNHPSVFGWSISNEVKPIVRGVMRNPKGMMDTLINYYGIWADICKKIDPTRTWISADGEDDGEGKLPTYIVHYGGIGAMERAEQSGKPWGVGEAGNAYYGTPEQVSEANGSRAYESFLGRMEGVAVSSYESLINQRNKHAIYRSVFNMVWYGLKPLPLGLKNIENAPTLNDGIYFPPLEKGQPGVQPERIGPYCTTLNPGYDASLPLYETWPLFDAIKNASAEPPIECSWKNKTDSITAPPEVKKVNSIKILSGKSGTLASDLKRIGVPVDKFSDNNNSPSILFIDGANPPPESARGLINQVIQNSGTVVVWGVDSSKQNLLNKLLPAPLEITNRISSSLVKEIPNILTQNLSLPDMYFSELNPPEIITHGLSGELVKQSSVLLKACNTNWLLWNKQPEYAKTAMVLRSEREHKPEGAVFILKTIGTGRLIVTSLPAAPRLSKAEKMVRKLLTNLGIELGAGSDVGNPLLKTGDIVRALVCGSFPVSSFEEGISKNFINPANESQFKTSSLIDDKQWHLVYNEAGNFDFTKVKLEGPSQNAVVYLSFWVSSPRSLEDLLIEPNIPVVNLEVSAEDATQVWLNGKEIINNRNRGASKAEALKLHQGWNHFLIKLTKMNGNWTFSGRLTCNQPDFLAELESALAKP